VDLSGIQKKSIEIYKPQYAGIITTNIVGDVGLRAVMIDII
jgi:hypothetical protein